MMRARCAVGRDLARRARGRRQSDANGRKAEWHGAGIG